MSGVPCLRLIALVSAIYSNAFLFPFISVVLRNFCFPPFQFFVVSFLFFSFDMIARPNTTDHQKNCSVEKDKIKRLSISCICI